MAGQATPRGGAQHAPSDLTSPVEIRTLVRMLDEFDYYEILKVERGAALSGIRSGYHKQSRAFHPDRYLRCDDDDLRSAVNSIAKRIKEAYAVLRHPVKRTQYNQVLGHGDTAQGLRFTQKTAQTAQRVREEEVGKTPKGREFFQLAQEERKKENIAAAVRNIKIALAYESDNPRFLAFQEELVKSQRGLKAP